MTTDVAYDFSSVGEPPSPSAKVQLRGRAELLSPACCAMCGNGTHALPYVDPQIFYDYEGQVYFCQTCVTEMATTVGCLDAGQSRFLIELNEKLAEENSRLKEELNELRDLRDRLSSVFNAGGSPSDAGAVSSEESVTQAGNNGPASEPVSDGTGTSAKPVKSGPGRRPNDPARPSSGYPTGLIN